MTILLVDTLSLSPIPHLGREVLFALLECAMNRKIAFLWSTDAVSGRIFCWCVRCLREGCTSMRPQPTSLYTPHQGNIRRASTVDWAQLCTTRAMCTWLCGFGIQDCCFRHGSSVYEPDVCVNPSLDWHMIMVYGL